MRYAAFDLEISTELDENWQPDKLGISCAATVKVSNDHRFEFVWHGHEEGDMYAERMTPSQCREMAQHLLMLHGLGFTIVTFNGLGFDFQVLAHEVDDDPLARCLLSLARNHVDVAFSMFCEKGFMPGLNNAARGMRLEGKTEGMSGALAPEMWRTGRAEQDQVLEYVLQDARLTGELYEAILEKESLSWITQKGRVSTWYPTQWGQTVEGDRRMLTVNEALRLPEPDVSWMDDPWTRDRFSGWL